MILILNGNYCIILYYIISIVQLSSQKLFQVELSLLLKLLKDKNRQKDKNSWKPKSYREYIYMNFLSYFSVLSSHLKLYPHILKHSVDIQEVPKLCVKTIIGRFSIFESLTPPNAYL